MKPQYELKVSHILAACFTLVLLCCMVIPFPFNLIILLLYIFTVWYYWRSLK